MEQYWLYGTQPVSGGWSLTRRSAPLAPARDGGRGRVRGQGRGYPAPSAPTQPPPPRCLADLVHQLQQPAGAAARPRWPPTSGAPENSGGRGRRRWASARVGQPSLPAPARIIIPVTCLPRHKSSGPRFWNTWRGEGRAPRVGGEGEKGLGARLSPPQKVSPTLEDPQRSCQRRPGPGPPARTQPPALPP